MKIVESGIVIGWRDDETGEVNCYHLTGRFHTTGEDNGKYEIAKYCSRCGVRLD